jgi:hypothetical protein
MTFPINLIGRTHCVSLAVVVACMLWPLAYTTHAKTLFPDQESYKREEQRRFEILLAHWDLPVRSLDLNEK